MRLNCLITVLVSAIVLMPLAAQSSGAQHIDITAKRFSYAPNQITLKRGQPVTLALSSEDVTHGLTIKELGIKLTAKKGHPDQVTFTPEKTGEFEGKCSVFCGLHHGSMKMMVTVTD